SSCDCDTFYASINLGLSQTNGRSSGSGVAEVVDVGVFAFGNSGSSNYNQYLLGGAVGKYIPVCLCGKKMRLRAEVEGIDRYDFNFVTNGFPGVVPAAPTPRFYAVHVDDVWTVSGNLWLDIPVADDIDIYTGFGLGASGFDASVTDTFVTGFSRNTEFSYKLGAGIGLKMTRDVVLDFGWRFVDLGQTNVNLSTIAGGAPAGNYELDLHSNEFVVAVRIDLF
ncbi:MAG: outer membrane beta-barrel protein, partial [Fuerstiella sp.]|nr:outer membrane beta-barrel protein [Fuerstiella sp.]